MKFLFRKNAAIQATAEAIRRMKDQEAAKERVQKKGMKVAAVLAQKLEGFELVLQEKANEAGVLYAAVTGKMAAKALRKAGFDVEEGAVRMEPVKETGERRASVSLPHGFEAEILVKVEKK